jgi:hypothetical protein
LTAFSAAESHMSPALTRVMPCSSNFHVMPAASALLPTVPSGVTAVA